MKKALLLLGLVIFQLSIIADSDGEKKGGSKKEPAMDQETVDTINSVFGKPELGDIPVPKGFKLLDESFMHKASSFRLGRVYLEGPMVLSEVETFYVNQMVLAGWTKQEFAKKDKSVLKFAKYILSFKKDREYCTVEIGRESPKAATLVYIDLKPLALN